MGSRSQGESSPASCLGWTQGQVLKENAKNEAAVLLMCINMCICRYITP